METFLYDMKYAARTLIANPGFAIVAIITLALGIGANTAIFSVVNAALIQPLPWKDSDGLVRVFESNPKRGWDTFSASGPNFLDWKRQSTMLEGMSAWRNQSFNFTGTSGTSGTSGNDGARRIDGGAATAGLLPLLGVEPALGRNFAEDEDRAGAGGQVAIVSHRLWQDSLGGDASILGRTLSLNGKPYTVVGVLPKDFQWVAGFDAIVPLTPILDDRRSNHVLAVFGRLAPGASLAQAAAEMDNVAEGLARQHPMMREWSVRLVSFYDWLLEPGFRRSLLMLAGAVGLVLLIACANVANLLLARAAGRRREFAVRSALGAGRWRLARQLITECLLISALGGTLGLLAALWGVDILRGLSPGNLPRLDEARVDLWALAFTVGLSLATGLLFGLVPALQACRLDLNDSLKEGGRSGAGGARQRLKGALVVAELALALLLLVGAGLLMRSFWSLSKVDPGFDPDNLITMQINLSDPKYAKPSQAAGLVSRLLERVNALPGVKKAAAGSIVPFGGGNTAIEVFVEDGPKDAGVASANWRMVSPGYFGALGVPLVSGRVFDGTDVEGAPSTIVVSQTMARRFWPGGDPVGRRLRISPYDPWMTVVGVVGDVRNTDLALDAGATMYLPAAQSAWSPMTLLVRGASDPAALVASIREEVKTLDSGIPVSNIRRMDEMIAGSLSQTRFSMSLLVVFAGAALVLSTVGVYGVMAFAVSQRTHEIGVRVALGARRADVLRLILSQAARLSCMGIALGLAASLVFSRLLSSLLFGVAATDPATFAGVALLLACVCLVAGWIPARRATRVDPMAALRCD